MASGMIPRVVLVVSEDILGGGNSVSRREVSFCVGTYRGSLQASFLLLQQHKGARHD